jgi:hypothetical protein
VGGWSLEKWEREMIVKSREETCADDGHMTNSSLVSSFFWQQPMAFVSVSGHARTLIYSRPLALKNTEKGLDGK